MASLTIALASEGSIGIITQAYGADWPNGLACKVINSLFKRYVLQDLMSKAEMRQALNAVTMKKDNDPAKLFEGPSGVCNHYKTTTFQITDEELIAPLLKKAPKEYSMVLTCEQKTKGMALSIDDLEGATNQLWRTLYGSFGDKSNKEMILSSNEKCGRCYKCEKSGHKTFEECRNRSKPKFNGKCNSCGATGHRAADCFKDPKNAGKIPEWYKKRADKMSSKGKTSLTSQNTEQEMVLMSYEIGFPRTLEILQNLNVWIAATGANVDSTRHQKGCTNIKNNSWWWRSYWATWYNIKN